MRGHSLNAQLVHYRNHVTGVVLQRGVGAMPGVATVQQQGFPRALSTDVVDQRCQPVHPANAPKGRGQFSKIDAGEGVDIFLRRQPVMPHHILTGQMRDQAGDFADTNVGRGFTEVDGRDLRVDVAKVQETHLPFGLELDEIRVA